MRLVVLGEDDLAPVAWQPARDLAGQVQLLLRPQRHEPQERPEPARGEGEVRLEQPLELQERLVVEADVVERLRGNPRLVETIANRMDGEPVVVLPAGESLFLCRGHDVSVDHQCRRRVVVEGRDAQDRGHAVSFSRRRGDRDGIAPDTTLSLRERAWKVARPTGFEPVAFGSGGRKPDA